MKTKNKKFDIKDKKVYLYTLYVFLFPFVLVASFEYIFNPIMKLFASSTLVGGIAEKPEFNISASLDSDTASIEIAPGNTKGAKNEVTINSNFPFGYTMYVSSANPNINNIATVSNNTSSISQISASTATFAEPAVLANNTWGYAIINNSTSSNSNTLVNTFDSSYDNITSSNKFAGFTTTEVPIKATNQTADNDKTDVYYATKVDGNIASGIYSGSAKYTITTNEDVLSEPTIIDVSPRHDFDTGGASITITGTNFSHSHTSVTSAVKIGDNNCTDVQVFTDDETNIDTITCTVPAATTSGEQLADISVTNWKGTVTLGDGFIYDESSHTLSFDINGGVGESPVSRTVMTGSSTTLPLASSTSVTHGDLLGIVHSDNISEDGVATAYLNDTNIEDTNTFTFDNTGISKIYVELYYSMETGPTNSWVSMYAGSNPDISDDNDAMTSDSTGNITGKLGGSESSETRNYRSWKMDTFIIENEDTLSFHFRGLNSQHQFGSHYYNGYYAKIYANPVVTTTQFVKDGYVFTGWNTSSAGDGVLYPGGYEYTPVDNTTLYATWCNTGGVLYNTIQCMTFGDETENLGAYAYVTNTNGIDYGSESSNTNGRGVYTKHENISDPNPIYYFRGDIDNNYVKLNNICWRMVRTTSAGGTKLIYSDNGSGECVSRNSDIFIAKKRFNHESNSLGDVGYMYGDRYPITEISIVQVANIYSTEEDKFYFSTSYEKNGDIYNLINPIAVNKKAWFENRDNIQDSYKEGYYYCINGETSCSELRYSDGITDDYYKSVHSIWSTNFYDGNATSEYYYGNDVTYNETTGKYKLSGNSMSIYPNEWLTKRNTLANGYHYTCFSVDVNKECDKVYYITQFDSNDNRFITLTNGDNLDTAKDKMFANTNDSEIKTSVDSWFKSNFDTNSNDTWDNGDTYYAYLEDEVYCSDRKITYGPLKSKEDNGYQTKFAPLTRHNQKQVDLSCVDEFGGDRDAFTVSDANGNGALKYPIGLLTIDEFDLAGHKGYLFSSSTTWLISPSYYTLGRDAFVLYIYSSGFASDYYVYGEFSVRPVITVKSSVRVASGNGTKYNPFILSI